MYVILRCLVILSIIKTEAETFKALKGYDGNNGGGNNGSSGNNHNAMDTSW